MDDKNTILCRCEDLTREDILKCIQDGYRTIDEIKRVTRAGMGPCQGRTCRMLIAQELSSYYKPISMGALADAWEETVRDGDEGSYGSYDPSATKGGGCE